MSRKVFSRDFAAVKQVIRKAYGDDTPSIKRSSVKSARFKFMFRVRVAADKPDIYVDTLRNEVFDSFLAMVSNRQGRNVTKGAAPVSRETNDDAIIVILDHNANDAKKAINQIKSIPDLERLIEVEKKNKNRDTVLGCATKQIKQIQDGTA